MVSSVHILSANAMMQRNLIDQLSDIFSGATINCVWVQSDLYKANYLTKIQKDPIGLINSEAYRKARGTAEYMDLIEESNTF